MIEKNESANSYLMALPLEMIQAIVSKLDMNSLLALGRTCSFFYNNDELKRAVANFLPRRITYDIDQSCFFIITRNHQAFACGQNLTGQLGLCDRKDRDLPTIIPVASDNHYVQIESGLGHTLLLTANGKVYSCGDNRFGQLGQLVLDLPIIPGTSTPYLSKPNEIIALTDKKIVQVACTSFSSLFRTIDGEVFICGETHEGSMLVPIPLNFSEEEIIDMACGSHHAIFLTDKGRVYSYGSNNFGATGVNAVDLITQPRLIDSLIQETITNIYCGDDFSIFKTAQQEIYVCGRNFLGQLGIGHNSDQNIPIKNEVMGNKTIKHVSCGHGSLFVLTDSGELYASGWNYAGQLGLGDLENRYSLTLIESFTTEHIIDVVAGNGYTIFWSKESMYISGKNKLSAFKFIADEHESILTPSIIRNPIIHENQVVSENWSGSRPWDID